MLHRGEMLLLSTPGGRGWSLHDAGVLQVHGQMESKPMPTTAAQRPLNRSCAIKGVVERARPNAQ